MKKVIKFVTDTIAWCWNNPVMRYIFFGGCTTLVNLGTYYILRVVTDLNLNIANTISIIAAILFAYVTNSRYVFETRPSGFKEYFAEFIRFIGARGITMVIEIGGVWVMADVLQINDYIAKFVIQFIVLVLNYIFSKFIVFTKKEDR